MNPERGVSERTVGIGEREKVGAKICKETDEYDSSRHATDFHTLRDEENSQAG